MHNHLVRKRTLNHLGKMEASLAKWLSIRLRTKWLRVRIPLLSLKLQIWCMFRVRSSLTFRQTIECRFTLKLVPHMIITDSIILMTLMECAYRLLTYAIFKDLSVIKRCPLLGGSLTRIATFRTKHFVCY